MLEEDPNRTHLPADPERIVALYEGTNQPVVQPAGRAAQPAQAAVVALRSGALFDVVVALTLTGTGENVIYAGPPVQRNDVQQALEEALNFAESMGFILDQSGFTRLGAVHRVEMLGRLPAFSPPAQRARPAKDCAARTPLQSVARLFAAFCALLVITFGLAGLNASCSGMSAEQRAAAAEIHQQLGDNLIHQGDSQGALKEYLSSLDYDETPEAHLGLGVIYAWSLGRTQDGEKEFKRALEMRPDYSEALTNLGALYIQRGRFHDALEPLEKA